MERRKSELKKFVEKLSKKGLNVFPIKYQSKEPLVKWGKYQQEKYPVDELIQKIDEYNGEINLGVIAGAVSGNLVVLDFDNMNFHDKFMEELSENYPKLYEKLYNTMQVETSKGIHYYIRTTESKKTKQIVAKKEDGKSTVLMDIKAKGSYVVTIGSKHPNGSIYKLTTEDMHIEEFSNDEYEDLGFQLYTKAQEFGKVVRKDPKENQQTKAEEIKEQLYEILKEYYKKGQRHYLMLGLSGVLKKNNIPLEEAKDIIKTIAERFNDNEINDRLTALETTYEKQKSEIAGFSLLKNYISYNDLKKIGNLFGQASMNNHNKYTIEYPGFKIMTRDGLTLKATKKSEKAVLGCVITGIYTSNDIIDPNQESLIFKIRKANNQSLEIKGKDPMSVYSEIQTRGLILDSRNSKDVFNAIYIWFDQNNKIEELPSEPSYYGYFYDSKRDIMVYKLKDYLVDMLPNLNSKTVRQAFEVLNQFAAFYKGEEKKWFEILFLTQFRQPFTFLEKQLSEGIKQPYIQLAGEKQTGKTSLIKLALACGGVKRDDNEQNAPGSSFNTPQKMGQVLSRNTYPILVNEQQSILQGFYKGGKENLLSNAIESIKSRGINKRLKNGNYTFIEFPQLAYLYFTGNENFAAGMPQLEERRIITFDTDISQIKNGEETMRFEELFRKQSDHLLYIHLAAFDVIRKDFEWYKRLSLESNEGKWINTNKQLLVKIAEAFDVPKNLYEWILDASIEEKEKEKESNIYDRLNLLRHHLANIINEAYRKTIHYKNNPYQQVDFETKIKEQLNAKTLNGVYLTRTNTIYLDKNLYEIIKREVGEKVISGRRNMAELFKLQGYNAKYDTGSTKTKVVMISLNEFIDFLEGKDIEDEVDNIDIFD